MILKPRDVNFILPIVGTPSDVFKYIALFNGYQFFETDLNGFVPNEIDQNYFLIDKIDLASPQPNRTGQEIKFDGVLFLGVPSNPATEINASTFDAGQFTNIISEMLTKAFIVQLQNYIKCDYDFSINNVRPLYNSNKYTKATNATGIEISYSLWI